MRLSRGRILLTAAAALIALAAGWYWGSPWWTLWRMREAARAGDLTTLAFYVDRRTIEARARAQFKVYWGSIATTLRPDSESSRRLIALARRKLAGLDREPEFRLSDVQPWLAEMPVLHGGDRHYSPYIVHRGLDSFEVRDRGASPEFGPLLTFRRDGLGWKLVDVRWGQQ